MDKVIVLYALMSNEPLGGFVGETALTACLTLARTYEYAVGCVEPSAEHLPYMGAKLTTSLRPKRRPEGLGE